MIVGQVDLPKEPPDLHATVCVDGYKCIVANPRALLAGYACRLPTSRRGGFRKSTYARYRLRSIRSEGGHWNFERRRETVKANLPDIFQPCMPPGLNIKIIGGGGTGRKGRPVRMYAMGCDEHALPSGADRRRCI